MQDKKAVYVVGATASGKTSFAIQLAKQLNGEIINADSMQIYKGMDIGTAKPTLSEREGIAHHLLDIVEPTTSFSVAEYTTLAFDCMDDIISRKKLPIVCGGTGLYINALTYQLDFSNTEKDEALRKEYETYAHKHGNQALWQKLNYQDPITAERLHPNDLRRVIRALETIQLTGKPLSSQSNAFSKAKAQNYPFVLLGLTWPRKTLVDRINLRVDIMLEQGLKEEAYSLYQKMKDHLEMPATKGLGYSQLFQYFEGSYTYEEAVERIKIETRQFAKRQNTWFKRDDRIQWFDCSKQSENTRITEGIEAIYAAGILQL